MKFQVGDKVRVIGNDKRLYHHHSIGDVGFVVDGDPEYEDISEEKVLVEVDGLEQTILETDLELVEREVFWGREDDNVNNPSHYGQGKIECIDYINDFLNPDEYQGYLRGNIAKYLHRWPWKGKPIEDLRKAKWYLERLIEHAESRQ